MTNNSILQASQREPSERLLDSTCYITVKDCKDGKDGKDGKHGKVGKGTRCGKASSLNILDPFTNPQSCLLFVTAGNSAAHNRARHEEFDERVVLHGLSPSWNRPVSW